MYKISESNVGDITPNGFEIVEINLIRQYKMRKKIKIKNDVFHKKFREKEGWLYCDGPHTYIMFDGDEKQYKFRDIELEY